MRASGLASLGRAFRALENRAARRRDARGVIKTGLASDVSAAFRAKQKKGGVALGEDPIYFGRPPCAAMSSWWCGQAPHLRFARPSASCFRNLQAKLPKSEHERVRLAYWRALNEASSVTDGKLRLQVLISDLEHAGYQAAARCLADDLDALVVHLRYPLRHRKRWRSTNLLERSLGEVRRRTKVIGRLPRRDQLPLPHLGRARPVLQPRQQRLHVHRHRPPTPVPHQVPASRPSTIRNRGEGVSISLPRRQHQLRSLVWRQGRPAGGTARLPGRARGPRGAVGRARLGCGLTTSWR